MRQWHQKRPGCMSPMPVHLECGRSHISGGSEFCPSHWYTPSVDSQNLPQDVMYVAPPREWICTAHDSLLSDMHGLLAPQKMRVHSKCKTHAIWARQMLK